MYLVEGLDVSEIEIVTADEGGCSRGVVNISRDVGSR